MPSVTSPPADIDLSPRYASIMRQRNLRDVLLCALFCVPALLAQQTTPTPAVEGSRLLLSADSNHAPVAFTPADFHALPHVAITVHNGHTNASETYAGVPLATLLAKINAPLGKELHGQAMTTYLVAAGSDGYSVVLSLAEVDPSFHEGQVLVVDTRDGTAAWELRPFPVDRLRRQTSCALGPQSRVHHPATRSLTM